MKPILLLLVFAAPLLAGEDFETRYHDAYAKEVVDGETVAAARLYLDLLRERDLPQHLKAQCRLRFAVTCVLLGRSDEARARLAALAADPDTPKSLLPQIAEYRKSIEGVGPGRALDKRLEELKFELGRGSPMARRDFQLIGKPAIPFLKKLLKHPDKTLQGNAFEVLCEMDAPGLVERWSADLVINGQWFDSYLRRNPQEMRALEKRLPALSDQTLGNYLYGFGDVPFSIAFLDGLATRPGLAESLVTALESRPLDGAALTLADKWIRSGADPLAQLAAIFYAKTANQQADWAKNSALLPDLCRRLPAKVPDDAMGGLRKMAVLAPPEVRMAIVEERVNAGKPGSVADAIATAIDASGKFDVARYAAVLKQWRKLEAGHLGKHLHAVLARLPAEKSAAWATRMFREKQWDVRALGFSVASDLPLISAALKEASPETASVIAARALGSASSSDDAAYMRGVARLAPKLARHISVSQMAAFEPRLRKAIMALPDHEAFGVALELVEHVAPRRGKAWMSLAVQFVTPHGVQHDSETKYRQVVAARLLEMISKMYGGDIDGQLFKAALAMLVDDAKRTCRLGEARVVVAAFVKSRLRYLSVLHERQLFESMKLVAETIPLQDWIPYARPGVTVGLGIQSPAVNRAARAIAEKPGILNMNVRWFLENNVAPDVRAEMAERLFREADSSRLHALVSSGWLGSGNTAPTPATLEATMVRLLATDDPNLADLAKLGLNLARRRPTRALYSLVRRLLAVQDDKVVIDGIVIARSLGQEDLMPDLVTLLDSLNASVRSSASGAIDSLAKLQKRKAKMREDLPGK